MDGPLPPPGQPGGQSPWLPRVQVWLTEMPGYDALQRRQAVLMQGILLALLGVLLLATALNSLLGGPDALTPPGLALSLGVAALALLAIGLLRRGAFTAAIGLIVGVCLVGITVGLARRGLPTHEAWLSAFIIPTLLAGLLLKRRYLLLTTAANGVLVLGVYGLAQARQGEPLPPLVDALPTSTAVIIFLLVLSLSSLFLDQFARAFQQALHRAATQTHDLEQARDLLQQRAAELAAVNAGLQAEITARQRTEAALRENEQRLFQFLEAVPLGLAIFDATGRPYYTNQTARAIMEQDSDRSVSTAEAGQAYEAYVAGTNEVYPIERRPAPRALAGEVSTADDMEIHHPDRVIPIQVWGAPIYDAGGQIAYAIAAIADITERKQRDAALRQSLERFAQAFRAIPEALALTRLADDVIIEVNECWLALTGTSREEVIGLPSGALNLISPEDRQSVNARLQGAGVTSLHDHEMVMRRKSGELRNVLIAVEILEMDGEPMALTVTCDITERKQIEAELRVRAQQQAVVAMLGQRALTGPTLDELFVEAAQLAAAGLDADYSALSALTPDGQALVLRSVYGWPSEWVGQQRITIDRTTQVGATLLANGPLILDEQHPQPDFGIGPEMYERGAISAISAVVPGHDRPLGVLVVHSTRRRSFTEHDSQFLQSVANVLAAAVERERSVAAQVERDAAAAASQAKSIFLSQMSHELRTPLNAILGFGELLEMAALPPRPAEHVGYILKAGRYLLGLIDEVLDIARIEAGRLALSPEPVLLRDVLEESLTLVRPSAAQRQITLSTADLATATPYVFADHQRLKQVVLNLLNNAIKYNRFGGRVEIAWEARPPERLRLTVSDTGRGIGADFLPRLFTPFERGADQAEVEGTGLGLALSQRLMAAMEGSLGLENTGPDGSTFWLDIPLAAPSATPAPPGAAEAPKLAAPSGPQRTLLLVDDNLSNLRLVERILELRPSITVLAAQQGRQGLELAIAHQPDLILLDLQLPDLSGDLVLRRLLDDPATAAIPVVIFSADATPGQISRLRAAGATDYLTKPFRVTAFLALIDRLLLPGEGASA